MLLEFPDVSSAAQGTLSAAMFAGMLLGGATAGVAADRYGRKRMLLAYLAVAATFSLLSCGAPSWPYLAAARALSGIGIGGQLPVVFTLYIELLPVQNRGGFLSIVSWFWAVGSICTALLAWLMIGEAKLSWRWFMLAVTVPNVLAFLMVTVLVPESPAYYALRRDRPAAAAVLRSISVKCRGTEDACGVLADGSNLHLPPDTTSHLPGGRSDVLKRHMRLLFRRGGLRGRTVGTIIVWFCVSFGWYGLILWLPKLFKTYHVHLNPYTSSLLVAAANIPGNLMYSFLTDVWGRRPLLTGSLVGACICAACLSVSHTKVSVVAVACLLNAVSMLAWNSLSAVSQELFPADVRGAAAGLASAFGRLGSLCAQYAFGYLIKVSVTALLLTGAGVLLVGGAAALTLPETKGVEMPALAEGFTAKDDSTRAHRLSSTSGLSQRVALLSPDAGASGGKALEP